MSVKESEVGRLCSLATRALMQELPSRQSLLMLEVFSQRCDIPDLKSTER